MDLVYYHAEPAANLRLFARREHMRARTGVKAAMAMPGRTRPALRTFTGHAR